MDVHSREQRSANMAAIRSRNTKPELVVRRLVHRMGFRYALHSKKYPGRPDILLSRHNKAIMVHGCFWHMHRCRFGQVVPATNTEFWSKKRRQNVERDRANLRALRRTGIKTLVVWECQTRDLEALFKKLTQFLD